MVKSQILFPGPDSDPTDRFCKSKSALPDRHYDTGLGSKIYFWALIKYFTQNFMGDVEFAFAKYHWPECKFIQFPDTKIIEVESDSDEILEDYKLFSIEILCAFLFQTDMEQVKKSDLAKKLKQKVGKYRLDFSMDDIVQEKYAKCICQHELSIGTSTFDDIEFIKPEANKFLEENFSNKIGMHLRRSKGVIPTQEYIQECYGYVSEERVEEWYDYIKQPLDFSPEEKFRHKPVLNGDYFKAMDRLFDKHPDREMYISSDMPLDFMKPFFDRYGSRLKTRHDYQDEFFSLFSEELKDDYLYLFSIEQALEECFDLFAFAHTKDPILRRESRWSDFAKFYRRKL